MCFVTRQIHTDPYCVLLCLRIRHTALVPARDSRRLAMRDCRSSQLRQCPMMGHSRIHRETCASYRLTGHGVMHGKTCAFSVNGIQAAAGYTGPRSLFLRLSVNLSCTLITTLPRTSNKESTLQGSIGYPGFLSHEGSSVIPGEESKLRNNNTRCSRNRRKQNTPGQTPAP